MRDPLAEFRTAVQTDSRPPAAQATAQEPGSPDEGQTLIHDVENFLKRFVVLPAHTTLPVASWGIATFAYERFQAFPYLTITSPTPRCGKTRLLEVLCLLVANPQRTANVSESALFRIISKCRPTLMLDEAETLRGKGERAEYLRGILNAGNRSDASVQRCVGQNHEVASFDVYCPKVIACIGNAPGPIADRAILIHMQRRTESDRVERFIFRKVRIEGTALQARCSDWVRSHEHEIEAVYYELDLPFLEDRDCESWEPLFALLGVADPSRLQELRYCAEALTHDKIASSQDDSLSLRLLSDVRTAMRDEHAIFTTNLLERLREDSEAPWQAEIELNARKLARYLKPFGISPLTVRIGQVTGKGYRGEDLQSVFSRYLASKR